MDVVLKYRGRVVNESDIELVRALIREHPAVSRRGVSRKLCHAWNWVQANGAPCDMVCRGLMLALERSGHVRLPPAKGVHANPLAVRAKARRPEVDVSPVSGKLKDLGPLE